MSDKDRIAWTQAQTRVIGKRYCTTCQRMQSPEGGNQLRPLRWLCAGCDERRRLAEQATLGARTAGEKR